MSIDRKKTGKEIGEIILIKEYPLTLRCDKIRKRVNEKLGDFNLGGISAKVIVNNYDKLEIDLSSSHQRISEKVGLAGGMDIITLKERINKAILNINKRLKNMKQKNETEAFTANKSEYEIIAQKLTKIIMLCSGDIKSTLMEYELLNLSEVCNKMTNGAIDNVVVEDGVFTFICTNGISQTFNSVGHSDTEINYAINSCIMSLMALFDNVKPLAETHKSADTMSSTCTESTKSTTKQKNAYNREAKITMDSIGKELDGVGRRKFSQRIKGKLDKCANRAGYIKLRKASISKHFNQMDDDNKERFRELYYFYDQPLPEWLGNASVNIVRRKKSGLSAKL